MRVSWLVWLERRSPGLIRRWLDLSPDGCVARACVTASSAAPSLLALRRKLFAIFRSIQVTAALALGGCSGAPLPSDLERAQRLEAQHDEEAALAAYTAIRAACPRPDARPHNDCGLAATREAQVLERLGRTEAAVAAWEALPARTLDRRQAARGLARAAELLLDPLRRPERAAQLGWSCIERYPEEAPADDALAIAIRALRTPDLQGLRQHLDLLAKRFAREDIGDNLLLAAAEIAEELGDLAGAVARLDRLAQEFPRSSLRDNAIWRAGAILRPHDPEGALKRLFELLSTRREAVIVGSYHPLLLDDAALLVGQIWLDDLHDPSHAIHALTELATTYTDSPLRDDALLELARAHLAAHTPATESDRTAACAVLAHLLHDFPNGNRARTAAERRTALHCP